MTQEQINKVIQEMVKSQQAENLVRTLNVDERITKGWRSP